MPIPLDAAVTSLRGSAEASQADERLKQRVDAVQQLLAEDLGYVEEALREVAADCCGPADAAAHHLISRGGKRVRPLALLLSAACFGVGAVPPVARQLAVVAELVHSATLLHDDVIDEGMERRGAPTSRRLWGNGMSVLAGDLLLVHSIRHTLECFPDALVELVSTLRQLVEGEVIQMRGRTELDVSEATYEQILRGKTASLFTWATGVGAQVAGATTDQQAYLAQFGGQLGMAFQLIDDVLDYTGEQSGKTLLADLSEGKLTLPLVLAVQRMPQLMEAVRQIHSGDREPVLLVSRGVVQCGACDEARRRAEQLTESGIRELRKAPPSGARSLLESVARQLSQRTS